MSDAEHTQKPVFVTSVARRPVIAVSWNNGEVYLADFIKPAWHEDHGKGWDEAWANAEFVARAWNSHDALVAACGGLLDLAGQYLTDSTQACMPLLKKARAALAAAEGEKP